MPIEPFDRSFFTEMRASSGDRQMARVIDASRPILYELAAATAYLAYLNRREGNEIVVVEAIDGTLTQDALPRILHRAPIHCAASGKLLLAHAREHPDPALNEPLVGLTSASIGSIKLLAQQLSAIRNAGFAVNLGEHDSRRAAIAAPIFNESNQALAAIGLAGMIEQFTPAEVDRLVPLVISAAREVSRELGWRGWVH